MKQKEIATNMINFTTLLVLHLKSVFYIFAFFTNENDSKKKRSKFNVMIIVN